MTMSFGIKLALSCLAAYLIGSLSGGITVSRLAKGPDLRTVGSKHTGASNVQRTMGWKSTSRRWILMILKYTS